MHTESESTMNTQTAYKPIISLENVSIRYRVPREKVVSIKEFAIRWLQRRLEYIDFWALNGVGFEVHRAEVFGIVGRNGAGKSTLLKVVARVLYPTIGRILVCGKVAPLLELGAGFHPELSGRENIFLYGTLLGYTHQEMDRCFDEIVAFAELSNFIDAPLRTYSTGMVARLGFSVATAHFADVLLVDEVLSVGDTAFQRKCIDRIEAFRQKGTTVLFVSHSMKKIKSLCQRAVWLSEGVIKAIGPAEAVADQYLAASNQPPVG